MYFQIKQLRSAKNKQQPDFNVADRFQNRKKDRTSLMLFIVCFLFFIAEFPQAILIFISILSETFYYEVYKPLGDLMDISVMINYLINFILYCSMSKEFRKTFSSYFKLVSL